MVERQLFTERMTEDQLRIIKQKEQGKSDEEKWYHIFGVLFPGATPPKSPCMYVCDSWRLWLMHMQIPKTILCKPE
jgi:hypothetical protein